jgi:hypothetical protein
MKLYNAENHRTSKLIVQRRADRPSDRRAPRESLESNDLKSGQPQRRETKHAFQHLQDSRSHLV